jgi:NAD(P)-dependent dehydrogenase (short-subunit alcohol dehydrogenase family)
MSQQHRVIVITGASGGIGRTCAVALSNAFPSAAHPEPLVLILSGRRQAELEATARECREGTVCEICVGDVSKDGDVEAVFERVREKYQRVDFLFNVSIVSVPVSKDGEGGDCRTWRGRPLSQRRGPSSSNETGSEGPHQVVTSRRSSPH